MTTLLSVPHITIGSGALDGLARHLRGLVDRPIGVLVVIDPGLAALDVASRVRAGLAAERLDAFVFDGFGGEPTAAQVDAAAALARHRRVEAVVGIGGGSALDIAKLAAAIATDDPGADHYQLCEHPFPPAPLPLIQVPTTAGTGSEATLTAVHTNAHGKKVWSWGAELAATRIILDADLTASLPPRIAAATGLDALVHAIEAVTNVNATPYSVLHGHEAIRLVTRNLVAAVAGGDAGARERMLWASCLAGTAINNSGTAIAHTIAHALGSLGKVHHGRAAALGLRASLPWNISHNAAAFAAVAEAMGGPRDAAALPLLVDAMIRAVGIEVSLARELPEVTPAMLAAEMALPENAAMRRSNAKPSTDADLLHLAQAVLDAR